LGGCGKLATSSADCIRLQRNTTPWPRHACTFIHVTRIQNQSTKLTIRLEIQKLSFATLDNGNTTSFTHSMNLKLQSRYPFMDSNVTIPSKAACRVHGISVLVLHRCATICSLSHYVLLLYLTSMLFSISLVQVLCKIFSHQANPKRIRSS
jgi:hypothetical protein